jgi:hypothetical protein
MENILVSSTQRNSMSILETAMQAKLERYFNGSPSEANSYIRRDGRD